MVVAIKSFMVVPIFYDKIWIIDFILYDEHFHEK